MRNERLVQIYGYNDRSMMSPIQTDPSSGNKLDIIARYAQGLNFLVLRQDSQDCAQQILIIASPEIVIIIDSIENLNNLPRFGLRSSSITNTLDFLYGTYSATPTQR